MDAEKSSKFCSINNLSFLLWNLYIINSSNVHNLHLNELYAEWNLDIFFYEWSKLFFVKNRNLLIGRRGKILTSYLEPFLTKH